MRSSVIFSDPHLTACPPRIIPCCSSGTPCISLTFHMCHWQSLTFCLVSPVVSNTWIICKLTHHWWMWSRLGSRSIDPQQNWGWISLCRFSLWQAFSFALKNFCQEEKKQLSMEEKSHMLRIEQTGTKSWSHPSMMCQFVYDSSVRYDWRHKAEC